MFIVFEGIDGSGKTTQIERLVESLGKEGHDVVSCKDPGSTTVGLGVREIIQSAEIKPTADADLLLFTAARVELWHKVIRPALDAGKIIVCDRFFDSTMAYQIMAKERDDRASLAEALHEALIDRHADLTIFIDVPVGVAAQRTKRRGEALTRFELLGEDFFERARQHYVDTARKFPEDWVVIDGELTEDGIADLIFETVQQRITVDA